MVDFVPADWRGLLTWPISPACLDGEAGQCFGERGSVCFPMSLRSASRSVSTRYQRCGSRAQTMVLSETRRGGRPAACSGSAEGPRVRRVPRRDCWPGGLVFTRLPSAPCVPPVRLVGFNHDVVMRNSEGTNVFKRSQALANVVAGLSEGTLTVVGGSDPRRLIGPGTYPITGISIFPIWARIDLGGPPPR